MTRYRLYRLAMISAGFLGTIVMGAGISALGLHSALRVVAFCALAGAAMSAGWHGIRYLAMRHEEHLQEVRRHRAPRPDLIMRSPAAAESEQAAEPEPWQPPEAETPRDPEDDGWFRLGQATDVYLGAPSARWTPRASSQPDLHADLYARNPASPA